MPNPSQVWSALRLTSFRSKFFAANPTYEDIKVSPKGDYLAATFFNPDDVTESKLVVLVH